MKKFIPILLAIVLLFSLSACESEKKVIVKGNLASLDEAFSYTKENAQEDSTNVNGKRYTINIENFTNRYNEIMFRSGGQDFIDVADWKRLGDVMKDANGVQYYCYYCYIDKIELTVAVETKSHKIMNIGCGTTMSNYVSIIDGEEKYSDKVLMVAAAMAAAVGGYTSDDVELFEEIFNKTTFENKSSLVYENNIFNLTTGKKEENNDRTMLFRYFPVTNEHISEWNIPNYSDDMT